MKKAQNIRMRLVFREARTPYLLDISSLLYDFELMHDFCLLLYEEEYSDYRFSNFFWFRKGRPIASTHRLRAAKIIKESPLTVELIVSGALLTSGALWALLKIIDEISNREFRREKQKLELEKLKIEVEKARLELEERMDTRRAHPIHNSLVRRLENNPIKVREIEILVEDEG